MNPTLRTTAALALALAVATPMLAQEKKRVEPPAPQPPREVRFPAYEQRTLPSGLQIAVVEHRETPIVTAQMLIRAGKAFEPAAKAALASATAQLLREGTATRSSQQIAQTIDSVGGNLNTNAGRDSAVATVAVTADQLDLAFDLLADVVLRPSFPAEELERWRRQSLNGLQVQWEDAAYIADATFERAVFGSHTYGLPFEGTPESLAAITRDDLVAFHRQYYVPNTSLLVVAGDVKAADVFARAERAFGVWPKGKAHEIAKVEAPKRDKPRILVVDMPNAVQTEVRIGDVGIAFADPDFFVADVYNSVLGGGSSARLYREVRTNRGLSYGAGSAFVKALQPGMFVAQTSTKTESTVQVLEVMLEAMKGLEKGAVPAEELEARKTYLSGVFPLQIETTQGITAKLMEALKYGLGRDFIESYPKRLQAVTSEQVRDFAGRRINPESALIVLVGNASAFLPDLQKTFGPAEVIPYRELDLLRADLRQVKKPQEKPAS